MKCPNCKAERYYVTGTIGSKVGESAEEIMAMAKCMDCGHKWPIATMWTFESVYEPSKPSGVHNMNEPIGGGDVLEVELFIKSLEAK